MVTTCGADLSDMQRHNHARCPPLQMRSSMKLSSHVMKECMSAAIAAVRSGCSSHMGSMELRSGSDRKSLRPEMLPRHSRTRFSMAANTKRRKSWASSGFRVHRAAMWRKPRAVDDRKTSSTSSTSYSEEPYVSSHRPTSSRRTAWDERASPRKAVRSLTSSIASMTSNARTLVRETNASPRPKMRVADMDGLPITSMTVSSTERRCVLTS
mmetsp:Transcript_79739/g.223168  ORF Transcript_79739/g.223168 Transcript_79739/m.223168 type:complete len:211 (+) Transcript_79739:2908-3540(+)